MALLLRMLAAGLAALIPLGAGADRWRIGAACAGTAILAGGVFPIFARWAEAGGWLARLGFLDAGGCASIQAPGGLTAFPSRGSWARAPGSTQPPECPSRCPGTMRY